MDTNMENENRQNALELDTEVIEVETICRLCATQNEKLVGIYTEEGISNDIANKINLYLPIKVSEEDLLPLQCCMGCTSTILAWHELIVTSVEADRRLRNCQFLAPKASSPAAVAVSPEADTGTRPEPTSLNVFCQTDAADEKCKRKKRKTTEAANYEPSHSLADTYMTNIEHHFIVDNNDLSANSEGLDDYKVDIEDPILIADCKKVVSDNFEEYNNSGEEDDPGLKQENSFFACPLCPAVFLLRKDFTGHMGKDHPGSNCVIKTEQMPLSQNSVKKEKRKNNKIDQDVTNAAKVVVDGRIYYNCKECGKSLHSPYTYVWHMRIHTGERPYVCDLCGKQFRVSQGLVRHLRETHQGIKKFPCDLCGRMFATRRNVEEHRRIHTNERPYICDLCGKTFKQKASLFVHKRSHNFYFPFKCSYCNQGFRTKPPLMVHITRHTGEKPYKCEICGRCFRIKYELKRHRLIHSDEKPFSCTLCGLSFRQKRYLRNHTKSNHSLVTT